MKRYFKEVESSKTSEIYYIMLTFDDDWNFIIDKSSCSCKFSSFYIFSKFWKSKGKVLCKHMINMLNKLKEENPKIKIDWDCNGYKKSAKDL